MDFNEFVIRHDGVLTSADARALGFSRSGIQRRIASGEWRPVARGVYLVASCARTARAQARLAVCSVGGSAVLGGAAAAWWLGLCGDEPRRHVVFAPVPGRHPRRTSTTVVRHRVLADEDVLDHRGLRVTAPALTALDASLDLGIQILDAALLAHRVTPTSLAAAHARYPKRHGASRVARYLTLIRSGARSEAERVVVRVFRRAGITGWSAGYPSCGYLIDFAFPDCRLAVEIDGFAFHRDATAFQHDRTRRNALIAAGWRVLNFTWSDVVDHPERFVAEIRGALEDDHAPIR
ncbi:hypothetical protein GOARA_048_00460 [Gordonia araii NBRC 100433]|uniref:DUF559 domain-containing protein n=1 Tax=Gordonia araii NBRC 100433 TaxID=1073574 RepID=G7H1W9_9ACTN|nr:DUF559 domain-containing protein [Gordonia araii]NNG97177.1 DUF559 domain-containing protein [Gordonia araii NBRC 100433]GAB09844.1 hypothetical protein GOARA_048_00460 [Gordonia araii NBRC 100433]